MDFVVEKELLPRDVVLLKVSGFLDAHTFEQLEEHIGDLFGQGRYRVVLDLSGVDYVSSAGAGVLINSLPEAEENDGRMVILNPGKGVMDVFRLYGLDQVFAIVGNREEALALFA